MIWHRYIACSFWLITLAGLAGCRSEPEPVAVIPRTTATLLWEPMHMGVSEAAHKAGLRVYWNAPADEGDTGKQLNLFALALKRGSQGIIFAPDESLASRSLVLQAVKARTPVVIVDDELGPPAGPYLSYVQNDEVAGTRLAAERIAKLLNGRGSVALLGINPRSEGGLTREENFEHALAEIAPGIQIKVRRFGDSVITHQQQIAQDVLRSPDPVDAIVALTTTSTRGAYYAKMASDPHASTAILGFDQDLLLPIQTGEVDAVVVQDTRRIGELALQNLQAGRRGESVPEKTLVAPFLLTREGIASPLLQHQLEYLSYPWSRQ